MQTAKEIEFFDRFGDEHEEYDVLGERAYHRLLSRFAEMIVSKPGDSCIDLGCGSGAFTERLDVFGLRLSGMDISSCLIESARSRGSRISYLVGDIMSTDLPDRAFDIVVYSGVLHHFSSADERMAVLREGSRLLKPGGKMFSYDPYAFSPSMFLYRDPRSPLYSSLGKTENEILISGSQMRAELAASGFEKIRMLPTGGMTFRYVEGPFARRLLPLYNLYEWFLQATRLERFWGTFLVCAARTPLE